MKGILLIGLAAWLFLSNSKTSTDAPMSKSGKRGIRNNNPGNIRISTAPWVGKKLPNTDGAFEQFTDMVYGARAMLITLRNYISKYGLNTLPKMISRWAPSADGNNPTKYADYVSKKTGIALNETISASDYGKLVAIATAMSWVENGETDAKTNGVDINLFAKAWTLI